MKKFNVFKPLATALQSLPLKHNLHQMLLQMSSKWPWKESEYAESILRSTKTCFVDSSENRGQTQRGLSGVAWGRWCLSHLLLTSFFENIIQCRFTTEIGALSYVLWRGKSSQLCHMYQMKNLKVFFPGNRSLRGLEREMKYFPYGFPTCLLSRSLSTKPVFQVLAT